MASPDDCRLKRFLLAKEFAEVFQSRQEAIPIGRLTQAYQSKHRRNFSPRQLGFSNLDNFVNELPIFTRTADGGVILDRSRFLDFFFGPVLKQCKGITGPQRKPAIVSCFKSCTGIEIASICKVLQTSSVEELLSELSSNQVNISAQSAHAGEGNIRLHNPTEGVKSETLQEDGASIQKFRQQFRAKGAEGASLAVRDPLRMDSDEYPSLSSSHKVLLPHPQPRAPSVIGGPPPQQVIRRPLQQPTPQDIPPNIDPYCVPLSAVSPQLANSPHHPHKEVISRQHPHGGGGRVRLIGHQQPEGPVPIPPIHRPSASRSDILPEYLPLSSGPTPSCVSPGPTPSRSPGPFSSMSPRVVQPQFITTHMPPPMVRYPSPLSQQQHSTTNEMVQKFPYPNLALGRETVLPSHSAFRRDLPVPQIPPGATEPPSSKKKRGAVESKQKAIEKINTKVEELIGDLSSQGKFLQPDIVRRLVMEMINKENRNRTMHDRIILRDITAMGDYSKVHGRIEELIKVFCWNSPVTSLHELEQALIDAEKVNNYEALHLGPITKHPKVIDLFKLQEAASLDTVPDISAYKIQNYLMKFISKKKRSEKYLLEDFLEYVCEREFAESVYHLCIRIASFPLAIQTNFRFRTSQSQARRRMEAALEDEMKILLKHETEKLRKKLSGAHADDPLSIRRDLAGKDPVQILFSVFNACNNHFKGSQQAKVGAFMQMITEKPALRHLFLLAIYEGAYGADALMPKFMEDHFPVQVSGAPEQVIFLQPQGEVLQEVVSHLRRTRFPVDLGSLARVEEMIADKFGAPNFDSLGSGSFLGFVASHDQACDALGGRLIGTNSSSTHIASVKKKVTSIIQQLKFDKRDDQDAVSACVTSQFGVDSFEDLSCGSVHKIISESQDSQQVAQMSAINYLYPLLLNGSISLQESKQGVGILGHQSREDALSCLQRAPLLEDLKQWSHWEFVYQPQHGRLERFLQQVLDSQPTTAVHALETAPGQLIRINPNSSVSDFNTSLSSDCPDPINTAGHLVSLIVKCRSIQDISVQLLASHVTTSLEKMVANLSGVQETSDQVAVFVYRVLIRIPFKICKLLASELFIDPLRKVTSTTMVDGLVKLCATPEHRRFFQALGMAIGIKAWADDNKIMLAEAHQRRQQMSSLNIPSNNSQSVNISPQLEEPSDDLHITTTFGLVSTHLSDEEELMEISETAEDLEANNIITDSAQSAEELEEREAKCKAVVEAIRHDEFGIGINLDPQQQLVAVKQREREGRGIKRLSLELYSKDTHFVLELIQNADDNDYHPHLLSGRDPHGEVPSLKFIINSHCIMVLNNEVGFSEKNIRAICDVGKSTKGAHRSGYIGQKGIGFKSVFRVSDIPEIHSNGFHIGFDASADPIGFILPHWIESYQADEERMWRTKIVLSLKESHLTSNMAKKFNDIQPSLLLFLHRLRSITVQDEVSGLERHMARKDRQRGIVDIQHTKEGIRTTDGWLVVKKLLDKASKFKPDVEATELALAFPITPDLSNITLAKDLQQQEVFAFLPLRSYGFRFILQGDFDLPSSREDVNSDSPWNQWLREEIPLLFIKSLDKMKELPGVSVMQAMEQFLQFIPLEGELHNFFQPVTSQILNLIKGTNCLPSDPSPPAHACSQNSFADLVAPTSEQGFSHDHVVWKQPSQLLFVKEKFKFIREHISQALLMTSLSLSYLNSSLLPFVNPALQYQLGMGSITVDHLVEIAQAVIKLYNEPASRSNNFSDSADSDSEESSDEEILAQIIKVPKHTRKALVQWIANWLACVHMVMEDSNDMGAETIDKVKKFAILPLEDGTMATTSEENLFFPPDDNTGESRSGSREFKAIFKEMRVVETALFEEGEALVQSRVRKVLELIGVRNLYPMDIIKHHILPQFKTGTWKTKKLDLLCNFLVFIKERMEQPGSGIKEAEIVHLLKDSVVLITNQGRSVPSKEIVHFSSSYLPDPDLEKLFPDVKWTVIKRDYLKGSSKKDVILSWVRFLSKLGVKTGIAVQRVNVNIIEDSPQWKKLQENQWRRLPPGGLTLRDWKSEEIEQIAKSIVGKPPPYQKDQMKKLAELLDRNWETEYKRYLDAQIYDERNENYLESTTASSFQHFLVQQAWLPDSSNHPDVSKPLFSGRELFDNTRLIHNLLHSHVPYIGAELKNEDFVNRLCIKRNVSKDDVMKYLIKWSRESCESDTPFCTSIEHMSHVYAFLKQESDDQAYNKTSDRGGSDHLIEKFQEEKLIYVPDKFAENTANIDVPGHFETVHTVCWKDPSSVLYTRQKFSLPLSPRLPKVLSLYYVTRNDQSMNNQVQQAFIHFGVPEAPRVASFITLLKFISTLSHHPEPEHVKDFTSIAFELVRLCNEDVNISPDFVYSNLKSAKVFPTENHVWVSLQECLLENDDKSIAKCFQKSDKIFFILWPDNIISKKKFRDTNRQQIVANQEAREKFITICKIPKLSSVVTPKVDYEGVARPIDSVKIQLSQWVPVIQEFIATNFEDLYTTLKDDNIKDKLYRLQVLSVMSPSCRYFIDHNGSQIASPDVIEKPCEYRYDGDTSTIFIATDKVEKPKCLLPALMKLFASNLSGEELNLIENFLKDLLFECPASKDELGELAEQYSWEGLPDGEPLWEIPLPKHRQYIDTEETPTDEESDSMSSEEDEVKTKFDSESKEMAEEEKRLTSWPPKAAVDPSDIAPRHMKQFPASAGDRSLIQDLSASVIGEEELREARKKHLQGYTDSEAGVDSEENPRKIRRIGELNSPSSVVDSETVNLPHIDSSVQSTKAFPTESRLSSEQKQAWAHLKSEGSLRDTLPEKQTDKGISEQASEHDFDRSKRRFHGDDSHTRHNYPEDSKWKAIQRLDSEIELVDIQEFVRNVEGNDPTPMVELIEDISLDDEESRFKVGRWGEQYVYIILKKMGHLPDGTPMKSISWINEDEETDKPYDILVELESDSPLQQCRSVYIEVKSTAANEKELVSISWSQLKFAEDQGENFHLYRVYSAGRPQSHLCMLSNLYSYIKDHHIRFSFVL